MASPERSDWSKNWKPSGSSVNKKYRCNLFYTITETQTELTINIYNQLEINSPVSASFSGKMWVDHLRYIRLTSGDQLSTVTLGSWTDSAKTTYDSGTTKKTIISAKTVKVQKPYTNNPYRMANQSLNVSAYVSSSNGSWSGQKMTATINIPLNPRFHFRLDYDANGGSGTIPSYDKFYNIPLSLTEITPTAPDGYSFLEWNTKSDGTGTSYPSGSTFTDNAGTIDVGTEDERTVLYAKYQPADPPTCDYSDITDTSGYSVPTKGRSVLSITLDLTTLKTFHERDFRRASLSIGSDTTSLNYAALQTAEGVITVTPNSSGEQDVILRLYDEINGSDGAVNQIVVDRLNIQSPQWDVVATFSTATYKVPDLDDLDKAIITVEAETYSSGWSGTWVAIPGAYSVTEGSGTWSITVRVGESYVDDPDDDEPNAHIRVTYHHSDVEEKEFRKAFYQTSRNANFSNGIYNTMFVSGCEYPNYNSRVWWCDFNNPLYFPDTNYVEVGSNDTKVMGLMKVGDYLGAIKQSKTTDTAIYLLYPTSFEEDTTYAVKQGVQGVGAIGRYAFNILRDETLFLSPKGVMAIAPIGDDEHKVLNRSYFVDGKLLKEPNLEDAYSFVFNGMYYLAINDTVYVLDGNQRNSWGNDKTNLVYECYYLTNVPADCFVKYNDTLIFSNEYGLCRFKKPDDGQAYVDDYSTFDGEENKVVKARWSTVFDDDNALHYYKTMKKKGNLVSVLPNGQFRYAIVTLTEDKFNADKTKYFTFDGADYIRCTKEDVYNSLTTYYERLKTNTKVFVRKDLNEPMEIQRQFGDSTEIPSELFINKKFKKYKRLQFILENDADEPFGVDEIIKQYTFGNYAKK